MSTVVMQTDGVLGRRHCSSVPKSTVEQSWELVPHGEPDDED
jgi:hypothetical protein